MRWSRSARPREGIAGQRRVVAWAFCRARSVARRALAGPETDALVASQLWLEIGIPLGGGTERVAGNVLANMGPLSLARER